MWLEQVLNIESMAWAIGMVELWLEMTSGTLMWEKSSSVPMIICICSVSAMTYMLIADLDIDMVI